MKKLKNPVGKGGPKKANSEKKVETDIEKESLTFLDASARTAEDMQNYYIKMSEQPFSDKMDEEIGQKLDSFERTSSNILKAYIHLWNMNDELGARWKDLKKGRRKKFISAAPANAVIDLQESRLNHFAQGLNPYKLLLICFIGSFCGVIVELIWCLLRNGYIESRSGLVYGPFNLLYGVGAVALTLALYKFRNRGKWLSFLGGMLIGSLLEYICSFGQELVFGSRSWDYSAMPFNINGRICLLYSVFWGFLGILWMKNIYPRMAQVILKVPNKIGIAVTWITLVFFVVNSAVTCVSVFRWSQRIEGVSAENSFWEFVDDRFPDERMERIFANMEFGETK